MWRLQNFFLELLKIFLETPNEMVHGRKRPFITVYHSSKWFEAQSSQNPLIFGHPENLGSVTY